MDKELIFRALENPALIPTLKVSELEEVAAQYPYFSAVQVLLARVYRDNRDHRFSGKLQHAAIYTGDRKILFDLLKEQKNDVFQKTALTASIPVEMPSEIPPPLSPEPGKPDELQEKTDQEISAPEQLRQLASDIIAEEVHTSSAEPVPPVLSDHHEPEIFNIEEVDSEVPEMDELNREILAGAVSSSIIREVHEDITEQRPAVSPELETGATPSTYAEWIYSRSRQMHFDNISESEQAGLDPHPEPFLGDEPFTGPSISHGITKIDPGDKKTHQREILDRFIMKEPRITPGKVSEYSTADLARESLEEDLSFVTETMAKMYIAQGKPEKARKAYRKLMELHPEKSIYFAAQLKNLDKNKKA